MPCRGRSSSRGRAPSCTGRFTASSYWCRCWAGPARPIFQHTEIPFGLALPPIFPASTGYGELLLGLHAYVAFTLLALVALHIGAAMHDYMISERRREPRD